MLQVPGAGKKVFRSGVITTKLVTNNMTSVIKIPIFYQIIITNRMPSGRTNITNLTSCFCRNGLGPQTGNPHPSPSKTVQWTEFLVCSCDQITLLKFRNVVIQEDKRYTIPVNISPTAAVGIRASVWRSPQKYCSEAIFCLRFAVSQVILLSQPILMLLCPHV